MFHTREVIYFVIIQFKETFFYNIKYIYKYAYTILSNYLFIHFNSKKNSVYLTFKL